MSHEPTAKEFAQSFLKSLTPRQREKLKNMMEHGYKSGQSIADMYHVDYDQLVSALKENLNVI